MIETEDRSKCAICLEPLSQGESHTIECSHVYHTKCILHWFRSGNSSCPLCRNADLNEAAKIVTFPEAIRRLKVLGKKKRHQKHFGGRLSAWHAGTKTQDGKARSQAV